MIMNDDIGHSDTNSSCSTSNGNILEGSGGGDDTTTTGHDDDNNNNIDDYYSIQQQQQQHVHDGTAAAAAAMAMASSYTRQQPQHAATTTTTTTPTTTTNAYFARNANQQQQQQQQHGPSALSYDPLYLPHPNNNNNNNNNKYNSHHQQLLRMAYMNVATNTTTTTTTAAVANTNNNNTSTSTSDTSSNHHQHQPQHLNTTAAAATATFAVPTNPTPLVLQQQQQVSPPRPATTTTTMTLGAQQLPHHPMMQHHLSYQLNHRSINTNTTTTNSSCTNNLTSLSPTFQLFESITAAASAIDPNGGMGTGGSSGMTSRNLSPIPFTTMMYNSNTNTNNNNTASTTAATNTNHSVARSGRIRGRNPATDNTNNHHHHHLHSQYPIDTMMDNLLFNDSHLLFGGGGGVENGDFETTANTNTDDSLLLLPIIQHQQQQQPPPRHLPPPSQQQQQQLLYFQQQQQQQAQSLSSSTSPQMDAYLSIKASFYQQQQHQQLLSNHNLSSPFLVSLPTVVNAATTASQQQHASYDCSTGRQLSPMNSIPSSKNDMTATTTATDTVLSLLLNKINHVDWMDEIRLNVSSISLTPISGYDIIQRIQTKLVDVVYKYIPCVDFLVNCQQELRRGMDTITTQKRYDKNLNRRHGSNNKQLREVQYGNQFYTTYISSLSQKFYNQTRQRQEQKQKITIMMMVQQQQQNSLHNEGNNATNNNNNNEDDHDAFINDAMKGLTVLQQDAQRILTEQQQQTRALSTKAAAAQPVVTNSCEAIKSAYLGGMKDGESWGLRKWLSKYGNALHVCTDLECILNACQKLPRDSTSTKLLATQLRDMTTPILQYLVREIPSSYQKHSSAHPYLPFFHRLESALRSMSNFDPDDDDVICLDDDSDHNNNNTNSNNNNDDYDDDDDDVVEVDNPVAMMDKKPSATTTTKKRIAVEAISTTDSDDDDDDNNHNDSSFSKRSKPLTNGYHHHLNNKNDEDIQSSSGESEVQSIVEIIDNFEQHESSTLNPTTIVATKQQYEIANSNGNNNDWACPTCSMINVASDTSCLACGEEILLNVSRLEEFFDRHDPPKATNDGSDNYHDTNGNTNSDFYPNSNNEHSNMNDRNKSEMGGTPSYIHHSINEASVANTVPVWPLPIDQPEVKRAAASIIANNLERIATMFDLDQQSSIRTIQIPNGSFWDGTQYGNALRLFAQIVRTPESYHFLECVDDDQLFQAGNSPLFSHVIKHPLSLRQIARSLLGDEMQQWTTSSYGSNSNSENGYLAVQGLSKWNMWVGKDLLQAIDLVFLNSLAYGNALNQGRSQHRSSTNQLRKKYWSGIADILAHANVANQKQSMPTRRAEKSGFVVYKIGES